MRVNCRKELFMKQRILMAGTVCIMLLAMSLSGQAQETAKKIRIGVYDNRAIALAYFGSEHNAFIKKRAEVKEARAEGDSTRIKELNTWVEKFQRQLHFQGFCRAPVDDLLLLVKDRMAGVARDSGVDLIGWYPDYTGAEVEIVDITDELVALFNPSEEKLEQIKQLKDVEPTALSDITHKD
jgi:hypothetical protein